MLVTLFGTTTGVTVLCFPFHRGAHQLHGTGHRDSGRQDAPGTGRQLHLPRQADHRQIQAAGFRRNLCALSAGQPLKTFCGPREIFPRAALMKFPRRRHVFWTAFRIRPSCEGHNKAPCRSDPATGGPFRLQTAGPTTNPIQPAAESADCPVQRASSSGVAST